MSKPLPLNLDQEGSINGVPFATLKSALTNAKPRRDGRQIKAVYWIQSEERTEGFLVRAPSIDEADPFTAAAASGDGAKLNTATRNLATVCTIYPERAELKELFEDEPFLPMNLVGKITEISGGSKGFEIKKT